tara:strand:+ start:224 stop:514 length:291 start_codon:yes stop_codon:yes gene_type:complete
MKIDRIKEKISNLKDSRDFYKCIHKNDLELLEELEEVVNFIHCCTELKVVNTDKINKLNDALKNIEEDEDFRLDDGMEWIKQKSFIEGKINALTNL